MEFYRVSCNKALTIFEEIRLQTLVTIDSDPVFASVVTSLPRPVVGWKDNAPGLTCSALALRSLVITSVEHDMFEWFLMKRKATCCLPLAYLALSLGCMHSRFAGPIKEGKFKKICGAADAWVYMACQSAEAMKIIPQPISGMMYKEKADDLVWKETNGSKPLWSRFILDHIEGEDSDDKDAPFQWVKNCDSWDTSEIIEDAWDWEIGKLYS